jgi:phage/plasmid-like protein (TIGR03299 family)
MSHELTQRANGQIEFAYLKSDGEPWHGLGQPMEENATNEEWQVAAGMDWRIKRSKVRYNTDLNGTSFELPNQHVLFRSDSKAALGIVSDKYKVVQPKEVLDFFRDIVKVGGLELSAAGTIYGGKRFWATAKIGEASPVSLKDSIGGYLLISTSADGSTHTEVRRTTIRTVCRNTLAIAMSENAASVRVSHRSEFDKESIAEFMELNTAAWDSFRHNMFSLANKEIITEVAENVVAKLLNDQTRESQRFQKIMDLFKGKALGYTMGGVQNTAYGLLNAITEYADHHTNARTDENRFISSQWGPSSNLKDQAFKILLAA